MFDGRQKETETARERESECSIVGGYVLHFVILFAALLSTWPAKSDMNWQQKEQVQTARCLWRLIRGLPDRSGRLASWSWYCLLNCEMQLPIATFQLSPPKNQRPPDQL